MRKIIMSSFSSKIQLVKGCPTDINGNGYKDDDFNHDGNTDQDDYDYYDGFMDSYWDENDPDHPSGGYSDAYLQGLDDGEEFWDRSSVCPPENENPADSGYITEFNTHAYY